MTRLRNAVATLLLHCVATPLAAQLPAPPFSAPPPAARFNGTIELGGGKTRDARNTVGAGTASFGIGVGVWLRDVVLLGVDARANGTIDIEESVPGVRTLQGVIRGRIAGLRGIDVGLGYGPAWAVRKDLSKRTTAFSATLTVPFAQRMDEPALALFVRHAWTGEVADRGAISMTTIGVRLDLRGGSKP